MSNDNFLKRLFKQQKNRDEIDFDSKGYIDVSPDDQSKISKMQESGKYMLDLRPDNTRKWVIRKNPNYITGQWIMKATIASSLSAIVSTVFIIKESVNKEELEIMRQSVELQSKAIDSLQSSLRVLNHTIYSLKPDTTGSTNTGILNPKK